MIALAVGAGLGVAVLAAGFGIRKTREQRAARERLLVQSGFRPCDGEGTQLVEIVRTLHHSTDLDVCKPWKRDGADAAIYWYEVGSEGSHDQQRTASDEFLCTIKRTARQPYALFLFPVKLERGFGLKMIEGALAMAAPKGLHKLELPESMRSRGVLAAYGPQGASLQDLFDDETLEVLSQGARYGIFAIRGAGDQCAMELTSSYGKKVLGSVTWQDTWSFVQRAAG